MRIQNSVFAAMLCCSSLFFACEGSQDQPGEEVEVTPVASHIIPAWKNLQAYEKLGDYFKNLDYSVQGADSVTESDRLLIDIVRGAVEGPTKDVIDLIKAALDTVTKEDHKSFYRHMLQEFMGNESRYQESVDYLDLPPEHINSTLASFPEESFSELPKSKNDALGRTPFNQATVRVEMNGKDLDMWFDTGAELSLLSESKAKEFGVIRPNSSDLTIGTVTSINVQANIGYIEELAVGNVLIKNHPVLIMKDEDLIFDLDSVVVDFSAILGWPAIRNMRVTLDDRAKTYEAALPKTEARETKNFFWFGFAGLKIVAENGQSLLFGLDTGAGSTELKANIFTKQDFQNIRNDSTHVGGAGGIEARTTQVVEDVKMYLSDHELHFQELETAPNLDFFFLRQDGTVGMDILKDNRITLDFPNREFKIESFKD